MIDIARQLINISSDENAVEKLKIYDEKIVVTLKSEMEMEVDVKVKCIEKESLDFRFA